MYDQATIDRCAEIVLQHAWKWKAETKELALPVAMCLAAADIRRLTNPLAAAFGQDFPDPETLAQEWANSI